MNLKRRGLILACGLGLLGTTSIAFDVVCFVHVDYFVDPMYVIDLFPVARHSNFLFNLF